MKDKLKRICTFMAFAGDQDHAPERFLLFKRGLNYAEGVGEFLVDEESMDSVIAYFKSRDIDLVIDYEHQTLSGEKAPAAGWIKAFHKTPEGLEAEVDWTRQGTDFVVAKEYRYFSPVVLISEKTKRAMAIHSVALTNTPKMRDLEPLVAKLTGGDPHKKKETTMNLLEVLAKIGELLSLKLEGDEEAQVQAVLKSLPEALQTKGKEVMPADVLTALKLDASASTSEVVGTIHALAQNKDAVSPEEFRTMKQKIAERDRDDLVAMAMSQGKITPAQKDWADEYALKDPAGFKVYVAKAAVVVPLDKIKISEEDKTGAIGEQTLVVAKMMGISKETLEKYGTA